MLIESRRPKDAELVIGLVAPIGTDLSDICQCLRTAFANVAYHAREIHMSDLLSAAPGNANLPERGEVGYYEERMNAGDRLREQFRSGDALAGLAVAAIRERRRQDGDEGDQAHRRAWIVNSLKHPEEAQLLRLTYGSRFVLVGVTEAIDDRLSAVVDRLKDEERAFTAGGSRSRAHALLARDEKDPTAEFGQRVRDTYTMADVFVERRRGVATLPTISRIVDLLFGRPFLTPTQDEQAMYHARAAALRSSAAGRQVGAVITNDHAELLTTGTNEVPKPGGGEYWHGDAEDHRDFAHGRDYNDQITVRLVSDILERLGDAGWLDAAHAEISQSALVKEALAPEGPLRRSRVMDLLEFGRVVHAEMAALSEAARRGVAVRNASMHVTTYPCHMCARLIIDSGIRRVVYIDPYPKSLVPEMYRDMIDDSGAAMPAPDRVRFESFVGISPRLFPAVFTAVNRGRNTEGYFDNWLPRTAAPIVADFDSLSGADALEAAVLVSLGRYLDGTPEAAI